VVGVSRSAWLCCPHLLCFVLSMLCCICLGARSAWRSRGEAVRSAFEWRVALCVSDACLLLGKHLRVVRRFFASAREPAVSGGSSRFASLHSFFVLCARAHRS
jgi:hypothetical protein